MPRLLHYAMILLLTPLHNLETSFQGTEVSNDYAMKLYFMPKSRMYPIMKVRKYPRSPFYGPALKPLCFFAMFFIVLICRSVSEADPSNRIVHKTILFGSNPMISVIKYFLAALTASCNLLFSSVLRAMPKTNCLLSTSLRLAGQMRD